MKFSLSLTAGFFLVACSSPPKTLVVRQFQLRNQVIDPQEEPSIRMEKLRRLHGAVSMEDRKKKLGQYYTFFWNDPKGVGQDKVQLTFQYQQGNSGSRIKTLSHQFPASAADGKAEFAVIGDDYFIGGKVLTWKATLRRGNRELATEQSYLWQ